MPTPTPAIHLPTQTGLLAQVVTILAIVLVVLAIVALIVAAIRRRRAAAAAVDEPAAPETPVAAPLPSVAELEDEAARLARAGRYGDAVHVLLLQAIRTLGGEAPPPESRTSRELLRQFSLTGPPRDSFGSLVAHVERFLFGGYAIGRDEYEACRQHVAVVSSAPGATR